MSSKLKLKRFNVYTKDQAVLDFVLPEKNVEPMLEEYGEVVMEYVIEILASRLGIDDPVAIFDETFYSDLNSNMSKFGITAYVYLPDEPVVDDVVVAN